MFTSTAKVSRMPKYRVDNPSKSLAKAKEQAEKLYGADNVVRMEDVEGLDGTRVEIETKIPVDIGSLSVALTTIETGPAAADKPEVKHVKGDVKHAHTQG